MSDRRRPQQRMSVRLALWAALGSTIALAGAGCGGGGGFGPMLVSPGYQATGPGPAVAPGAERAAVSVAVTDARSRKLRSTNDGQEVLAEGDKGAIAAGKPVARLMEEA